MCVSADSREQATVVLRRDENGKATVWCDPCIADVVAALNAGGARTVASCCGHGSQDGSIVLADGRELVIRGRPLVSASVGVSPQEVSDSAGVPVAGSDGVGLDPTPQPHGVAGTIATEETS